MNGMVEKQKMKEIQMKIEGTVENKISVKTGTNFLKDFGDRGVKTEAGNCMVSGLMIVSLPDMCAFPVKTCRKHELESASVPLCLCPCIDLTFLCVLLMKDAR